MNRKLQPALEKTKDPTNERLFELAELVVDPSAMLGPMDQQDLREALIELLARRNADTTLEAAAPQVQAA